MLGPWGTPGPTCNIEHRKDNSEVTGAQTGVPRARAIVEFRLAVSLVGDRAREGCVGAGETVSAPISGMGK